MKDKQILMIIGGVVAVVDRVDDDHRVSERHGRRLSVLGEVDAVLQAGLRDVQQEVAEALFDAVVFL